MRSERKYFEKYEISPHGGRSHLKEDWNEYWNSLDENEKQSLRDKAQWEHMTLSAVAVEWGAIDGETQTGRME